MIRLSDGAELEFIPDPVIPYAGSRHSQRSEISVGRGATFFWWDVVTCGRLGAGERFAFDRLDGHTQISVGDRPVLREDYRLEPARRDLAAAVRMHRHSHVASLYAVQDGRPAAFWRKLEDRLNEIAQVYTRHGEGAWGATALVSDGILVRGLTMAGRFAHAPLLEFWRAAHREITGKDAVPPRKTY